MLLSVKGKSTPAEVQRRVFFKLGIVGVKETSRDQEVDKEAVGMEYQNLLNHCVCVSVLDCVWSNYRLPL